MDLSFLHMKQVEFKNMLAGFQSLFLWIFRSYAASEKEINKFLESVSILVLMDFPFLQDCTRNQLIKLEEFQSLFLWIFRSYKLLQVCKPRFWMFQSLFLWIFRSYGGYY